MLGDENTEALKEEISSSVEKQIKEFPFSEDRPEDVIFVGFYKADDNSRGNSSGVREISLNEKYLGMSDSERARVVNHELQHLYNDFELYYLMDKEYPEHVIDIFMLNPEIVEILERMQKFYDAQKEEGAVFQKARPYICKTPADLVLHEYKLSYGDWDEFLALLRGYKTYLDQTESGESIKTEPYEFIGAFKPEDTRFLDSDTLLQAVDRVVLQYPQGSRPEKTGIVETLSEDLEWTN